MTPLLVLRVGYMERYDGPGPISGGGDYVKQNGVGGEVFNFKPSRGVCYGYAMSRHSAGINLRFLDDAHAWSRGDELSGVDVVFIARRPGQGQVVVGWYRNATVFHRQYRVRRGRIPGMGEASRWFLCVAKAENAFLLSEEERNFEVPAASAGNVGFPGQSNVWYPDRNHDKPGVRVFVKKLRRYIESTTPERPGDDEMYVDKSTTAPRKGRGARSGAPDVEHNAAVEQAAVEAVKAHFESKGYSVTSVESENKGWDLEASNADECLYVEVKGTAGDDIYFELTPNEYGRLREHAPRFRVCVVCDALGSPRLHELSPSMGKKGWELFSADRDVYVPLMERVAAIGVESVGAKR